MAWRASTLGPQGTEADVERERGAWRLARVKKMARRAQPLRLPQRPSSALTKVRSSGVTGRTPGEDGKSPPRCVLRIRAVPAGGKPDGEVVGRGRVIGGRRVRLARKAVVVETDTAGRWFPVSSPRTECWAAPVPGRLTRPHRFVGQGQPGENPAKAASVLKERADMRQGRRMSLPGNA